MSLSTLIRVQWLYQQLLRAPKHLRIIDGSWHLPSENRDPKKEFHSARIPGAKFFDIEECTDKKSSFKHMIPHAEDFANYVKTLGIRNDSHVVVYDNNTKFGMFSAPRVWWTFRAFGHNNVSVLDGGLPKWLAEGYPAESGPDENTPVEDGEPFKATFNKDMFVDFDYVKNITENPSGIQVADARSRERYIGTATEPRAGFPVGHIPHSKNLPFSSCLHPETRMMKDPEALKQAFQNAGIDLSQPLITTCGSGITACVVALAAHLNNKVDTMVYDGSWTEWATRAPPEMIVKRGREMKT